MITLVNYGTQTQPHVQRAATSVHGYIHNAKAFLSNLGYPQIILPIIQLCYQTTSKYKSQKHDTGEPFIILYSKATHLTASTGLTYLLFIWEYPRQRVAADAEPNYGKITHLQPVSTLEK